MLKNLPFDVLAGLACYALISPRTAGFNPFLALVVSVSCLIALLALLVLRIVKTMRLSDGKAKLQRLLPLMLALAIAVIVAIYERTHLTEYFPSRYYTTE